MKAQIENRRLRSCLWLVSLLQRHRELTYAEINAYWCADADISGGSDLPRRTFTDYCHVIEDTLGMLIECNRRGNTYSIGATSDGTLSQWLISSFSVSQLVRESEEVRDRIILGLPPSGMGYFNTIVEAFRNNCCIRITYQKFDGVEPYDCHLQPYCLKIHQQRWYLLAIKDHGTRPVTFALDRMKHVELLHDEIFMVEDGFSAQEYYKGSFGVWTQEGEAPEVLLRAYGSERNYLRTLPLHASQREVKTAADYSDFVLKCFPTRDLLLHLLSHGQGLEVLSPDSLRRDMAHEVRLMMERYG